MKNLFHLIFFIFYITRFYGQSEIKRCGIDYPLSVCENEEMNGDITISWKTPSDPEGVFLKYELFSTESPFTPLTSISTIQKTSVTLPNNFSQNNFFLITSILCNNSVQKLYSDTSSLIELTGVKIDDGIEQLNWQNLNTKNLIYIERAKNQNQWIKIDSITNQNQYLDTVDICNNNKLYYRIGNKKSGCVSYSTIISDSLKDSYNPTIPRIASVGFDTSNQNLIISWNKQKENDIQGYIIYQENNGLSSTLDTLLSTGNKIDTFYTIYNPTINAISNYRIAAFDFCYSVAPKFQTSAQSQPFYSTILSNKYDVCTKEVVLNWNKIITNDDVIKYKIFLKKFNKWQCVDSTSSETFKLNLEKFTNNTIAIEGITKNGNSFFSNNNLVFSKSPTEPKISYTNYSSVIANHIEIKHTIEPNPGLKQLALFKRNEQNEFIEIQKANANQNEIIFKDLEVETNKNSYNYYIQHVDSCNNYTKKNLIQQTILLKENYQVEDSFAISMLFNSYQGYISGNNKYIIERSLNDLPFTSINSTYSDSSMIYNDKIEKLESFEGKVCYKIKCVENTNIYMTTSESYSNQICFYFDPKIFIPNAFTPNGINPIFKPIISIADIENYELTIINRWGQPVFNTKKIEDGWNGQMGNQDAPNGLYIYQIQINTGFKKEIIKRGLINLIR